ncbi:MAG: hypothetical protein QOG62_2295 [Thermoleophilaceae bacterium]|jgi:chromate reductase|nr:hypothetical protein [Thermoleophilaceae bacterium]
MRVLGISGSLRQGSHNTNLLRAAAQLLPSGAELELFEGLGEIPPFNEDLEDGPAPEPVQRLRDAVAAADAILIATPEYNSSLPGQLKNALDWVSRPVATNPARNKPVAVVGASTSLFGAVWAQAEARKVMAAMGARVLDRELPIAQAGEETFADSRLTDDDIHSELGSIVAELVAEAETSLAAVA